MNLLFRLKKGIKGFESIGETKLFFERVLVQRDQNYFYHKRQMHKIYEGDIIYFSYDSYIVATAVFEGEIIKNTKRDKEYIFGHFVSNIQIVNSEIRLDSNVFSTRIRYIETKQQQKILDSILVDQNNEFQDEIEEDYFEGGRQSVYVNRYERDQKAREACIRKFGAVCYICGFDFCKVYGNFAKNVIHVHHKIPLSEIGKKYKVDPVRDLIPLCPNCHTAIHLKNAPDIEELNCKFQK